MPDASALPANELAYAADDPPIVQPLGAADKASADIVASARARLSRTADALVPLPSAGSTRPVFVGLPDSSPAPPDRGDDIALESVSHGFDLAWMTRFLACPNGSLRSCLARVRTDLALGRTGGRGARVDLASSVVRLVRAWKKEGRPGPLVIPIAAGWEPLAERALPWRKGPPSQPAAGPDALPEPESPYGGSGAPLSPGARGVLWALHHASCHGALIIAAAGNDPGYRDSPSGPMLPAAWELVAAPSPDACKAWFGDEAALGVATPRTPYTPLVHAIGGVDERDHPIAGTRRQGLPRLVAPAALAAAYPDDPADAGYARLCARGQDVSGTFVCDRTTPRTGTSVAAAVTAGVAAVVWAHHPAWSGHDVMSALYSGGMSLGEKPDFMFTGKGKETIVRVSLCGALAASCKGAPKAECPERLTCSRPPAFARGPKPSPFIASRPGQVPLTIDRLGAGIDPALVCPGCALHTRQRKSDGCELEGKVPAALFADGRVARVGEPGLDLHDAYGRRLGYVETPGFRPQEWSAADREDQSVYTDAASCSGAVQAVLRFTLCLDAGCSRTVPVMREVPIVE